MVRSFQEKVAALGLYQLQPWCPPVPPIHNLACGRFCDPISLCVHVIFSFSSSLLLTVPSGFGWLCAFRRRFSQHSWCKEGYLHASPPVVRTGGTHSSRKCRRRTGASLSQNSLAAAAYYNYKPAAVSIRARPEYLSGPSPTPQRPPLPLQRATASSRRVVVPGPRPAGARVWKPGRWRRRWGRCAAPEGGRTRPSGASIPTTPGELAV